MVLWHEYGLWIWISAFIQRSAYEAGFQWWKHGKKTKVALIFEAKEKQMEQEGTDEHVYAEERNNKPKTRKKINVCKEYLYIYSFIYFLFIHFVFGLCMFILAFLFFLSSFHLALYFIWTMFFLFVLRVDQNRCTSSLSYKMWYVKHVLNGGECERESRNTLRKVNEWALASDTITSKKKSMLWTKKKNNGYIWIGSAKEYIESQLIHHITRWQT